jgi:hypothetical protein
VHPSILWQASTPGYRAEAGGTANALILHPFFYFIRADQAGGNMIFMTVISARIHLMGLKKYKKGVSVTPAYRK